MAEALNIAKVLCAQAQTHPDKLALIETRAGKSRALTFAQLEHASARAGSRLQQWGIQRGDAVLVFIPMSIELYVALIALFRLGGIGVFLDPSAGKGHIERCLKLYPPRGFIGTPKAHLLRLTCPALRRIPVQCVTRGWFPGKSPLAPLWQRGEARSAGGIASVETDLPALITFTSGSTGQPKAAVRTHGFLLEQHRVLQRSLGLDAQDVVLSTLPVFVLSHLGCGVTSLLPSADLRRVGSINPEPVLDQIEAHQVTVIEASPAFLACFLRAPEKTGSVPEPSSTQGQSDGLLLEALKNSRPMRSIRKVFTGGAPVFPRLLNDFQRLAPRAQLIAVYGSTEVEPIAEIAYEHMSLEDVQAMRRGAGLLAGVPIEDIALRILPDHWGSAIGPFTQGEFEAACLPSGDFGEIGVSGAHVLQGYLHGQGDAETKFKVDGTTWHRTGDAGYLDEQGRLWLLGRCAARIQDERGVIYPFAVECALSEDPRVRRSALVRHRGARVLVVELNDDAKQNMPEIKAQLRWAHLDEVVFQKIPVDKRHNAKVDYPALFALLDEVRGDGAVD